MKYWTLMIGALSLCLVLVYNTIVKHDLDYPYTEILIGSIFLLIVLMSMARNSKRLLFNPVSFLWKTFLGVLVQLFSPLKFACVLTAHVYVKVLRNEEDEDTSFPKKGNKEWTAWVIWCVVCLVGGIWWYSPLVYGLVLPIGRLFTIDWKKVNMEIYY